MAPHGAVSIAGLMLPAAATATTTAAIITMATTTMGTTTGPARPPRAGVGLLPGIMAPEAPTAPAEVPLRGAAVPEAPRVSEAALLPGVAGPAPITGLSAAPGHGVVDNTGYLLLIISSRSLSASACGWRLHVRLLLASVLVADGHGRQSAHEAIAA